MSRDSSPQARNTRRRGPRLPPALVLAVPASYASRIQDFCQEAYLRILNTVDPPESSQTFLFRTARNLVIDAIRHRDCRRIDTQPPSDAIHELTRDREVQGEQDLVRFLSSVEPLSPQKRKV